MHAHVNSCPPRHLSTYFLKFLTIFDVQNHPLGLGFPWFFSLPWSWFSLYFSSLSLSLSLFFPCLHFLYLSPKSGGTESMVLAYTHSTLFREDMFFVEFSTVMVWIVSLQKVCPRQGSRGKITADFRLGPDPKTGVLVSGETHAQQQKGEGHVMMHAEIAVMPP